MTGGSLAQSSPHALSVAGGVTADAASSFDLDALRVGGPQAIDNPDGYAVAVTRFTGTDQLAQHDLPYRDVEVHGGVSAGGETAIGGDLIIEFTAGSFQVGPFTVTVAGDLDVKPGGELHMNDGSGVLDVEGSATIGGGSTSGDLTAGTLRVAGDFAQAPGGSHLSFAATGSHVTVLDGAGAQTVTFNNPVATSSRFRHLVIDNAAGDEVSFSSSDLVVTPEAEVSLSSDVVVTADLDVIGSAGIDAGTTTTLGGTLFLRAGSTLRVDGAIAVDTCDDQGGSIIGDNAIIHACVPLSAPTIAIESLGTGSVVFGTQLDLTASATDEKDPDGDLVVEWFVDEETTPFATGSTATLETQLLSLGTHTVRASVTDSDGLESTADVDVDVESPGLRIQTPADDAVLAAVVTTFSAGLLKGAELGGDTVHVPATRWSYERDGGEETPFPDDPTGFEVHQLLPVGSYRIIARIGNAQAAGLRDEITVTVAGPSLEITSPTDGATIGMFGEETLLEGTAFHPDHGDLTDDIQWSVTDDFGITTPIGTGTGLPLSGLILSPGDELRITARVTPEGGDELVEEVTVTVGSGSDSDPTL